MLGSVQLAFTYLPVVNHAFGTAPQAAPELALAASAGVLLLLLLEAEKAVLARWRAA